MEETDLNRIYVAWEGGYFITTLDRDFNKQFQEMVADLGQPTVVEFRATNQGWYKDPQAVKV
jgi:hypothetical protein